MAEIDTIVIGGTAGLTDSYSAATGNHTVDVTAGSTALATIAAALNSAWNADPVAAALATSTVSNATMTLTGVTAGYPLNITVGKSSTSGTITLAQTTAPLSGQTTEVDTWTLTTNPSTGDTFTLTITYPGSPLGYLANTLAVVATVGSTQTVAAATVLIKNAWNANPQAAAYAVATSSATTVVLTAVVSGSKMSVVMTTSSATTTLAKTVTTPSFGRNISDILAGNPGAHIQYDTGYWSLPG